MSRIVSESVSTGRLQAIVRTVLVLYWASMFIAAHLPHAVRVLPIESGDKVVHFATYALLAALCFLDQSLRGPTTRGTAIRIGLLLTAYAVLDELLQIPVPGRYCDSWDFLADLFGIAIGLIGFALLRRHLRSTS